MQVQIDSTNCSQPVSVPFDAGRGLMPPATPAATPATPAVSVPFDAGRGLMHLAVGTVSASSAIVSVPFDAGRGLMRGGKSLEPVRLETFQYPSMRVVD